MGRLELGRVEGLPSGTSVIGTRLVVIRGVVRVGLVGTRTTSPVSGYVVQSDRVTFPLTSSTVR